MYGGGRGVGIPGGVRGANVEGVAACGSAGASVWDWCRRVQLPPSMRHSKVEPGSEELKEKLGGRVVGRVAGVESIVVFGAVRSIVQV